ncbi:hypothetical protein [Umezawaea sp. Da 62-37]|uniref:hypothetical protein n=1 Tax=Umezawaea sp. Da 62-37 TaxID=3075927 RepID=UPI0028F6F431|nr:hypothetical protein [Umezawaea sp. Da 62-37]WNV87122.1 hypothetical protein RM788_02175 [Umezawaea sp. Da 62-37]
MKRVLVPVLSVGVGQRLLDVAELLDPDPGLRLVFTAVPSTTANGVGGLLRAAGVAALAWDEAVGLRRDLVITSSHDHPRGFDTPTVVIPDPCGRRRPPRRPHADRQAPQVLDARVAGRGTRSGRTPVLRLAAHSDDVRTPDTPAGDLPDPVAVVGDLTFDRLLLSRRHRDTYRAALRVDPHHRLVVVVSTWGAASLISREPELLHRLAVELPEERYRVAVLLHPAAWFSQDVHHLNAWMTTARTTSVQIVDPFTQWRPVVAGADLVIGAHGSIALYSTGMGLPVLLADPKPVRTTSSRSPHATSPLAGAPQLRRGTPLPDQLDAAENWHTGRIRHRAARHVTSAPGQAGRLTLAAIYRMLDLTPPGPAPMLTPVRAPRRMI